ncbi:BLUF-domain-containing protein [Ceraceosorus guamensis]|uniref:BLUF-domain-containing protein n=1 Tax=Ceraceosorus guamensis TaxID=1522189 RepID=A0A316VWF1_9BASI|nr:BLUF-domain-containing protein [Ceraceosorus guamensis]PWN41946.1 BLUF-domain-containing protein [Ceraceosorus guamensis]
MATSSSSTSSSSSMARCSSAPGGYEELPLLQIVYASSSPERSPAAASVEQILRTSRRNNAAEDITGLLLFHDGSFVQFLEGPPANVKRVYERIRKDDRHRGVIEILSVSVAKRSFADWSMAYRDLSAARQDEQSPEDVKRVAGELSHILDSPEPSLTPDMSPKIRRLIGTFHRLLST